MSLTTGAVFRPHYASPTTASEACESIVTASIKCLSQYNPYGKGHEAVQCPPSASWVNSWLTCYLWRGQVLVPPLKDLECYIFENINTNLWSNVLVETAMSEAFASVAQSANHSPHHPRISQQELAIHRWHDALAVR